MATNGLHTRRLLRILGLTAAGGLLALAFGCDGDPAASEECLPYDFEAVTLSDGGSGFLQCDPEGTAYVPYYGPNPNVPPDAGASEGGEASQEDAGAVAGCGTAGGAKLGFMCPGCTMDSDCASGLVCFDFPNKTGNICTRDCTPATQATLCPAPSEGCGNNGHCKP